MQPRYPLHIEAVDQGKMTLASWQAHPLGRDQLLKNAFHEKATLKIEFEGVLATNEAGGSFDWTGGVVTYPFTTSFALGPVALIPGGWLPSVVAGGHHLLTLDRHLVTDLVAAEKSMQGHAPASLLALLTGAPVQLNVLPAGSPEHTRVPVILSETIRTDTVPLKRPTAPPINTQHNIREEGHVRSMGAP